MARAEYILSFDPGTNTGWAIGAPGDKAPQSGSAELRRGKQDAGWLSINMRALFIQLIALRKPDLVVWEAPWDIQAWLRHCIESKRYQNGESVIYQNHLALVLRGLCEAREMSWQEVPRQTVLKHFTGTARHASAVGAKDGRDNAKRAVIARCHALRYVPDLCKDDDRCDAIANFDYAAAMWGGRVDRELLLHDQGKMRNV